MPERFGRTAFGIVEVVAGTAVRATMGNARSALAQVGSSAPLSASRPRSSRRSSRVARLVDALGPLDLSAGDRARPSSLDRDGRLLRPFARRDGPLAPAGRRPGDVDPRFLAMLKAYEDGRFDDHPGVDPLALLRAGGQLLRSGRIVSGGSTLTMQVARLLEQHAANSLPLEGRARAGVPAPSPDERGASTPTSSSSPQGGGEQGSAFRRVASEGSDSLSLEGRATGGGAGAVAGRAWRLHPHLQLLPARGRRAGRRFPSRRVRGKRFPPP